MNYPSHTSIKDSWLSRCALYLIKLLGWKIHNITPTTAFDKAVVILAPHTSNWDFVYGMLFRLSHPTLPMRFAIKKEVMFFPLSYLMNALGAIPIDRQKVAIKENSMVTIMADLLNKADKLLLMIAPEGTRKYAKRWKTGFYRLSEATQLPIILGYINYAQKEMGLGPTFYPTGHIENDILAIQSFYRNIPGKYPEQGVI
ncbi:MAG: 1-acyl-sn-glycerol-3-phosphate acyltransferase [Amoebophilaceae bacterium]|nr:1-acyl-sn-glycerol-3-phosphate acyltransferase [Amoebophilaceae bacterium]